MGDLVGVGEAEDLQGMETTFRAGAALPMTVPTGRQSAAGGDTARDVDPAVVVAAAAVAVAVEEGAEIPVAMEVAAAGVVGEEEAEAVAVETGAVAGGKGWSSCMPSRTKSSSQPSLRCNNCSLFF